VPRTSDTVTIHFAIAKSATIMRAQILDAVDFAFNECDDHKSVIDLHRLGEVGCKAS
jgi:hypothetical protein